MVVSVRHVFFNWGILKSVEYDIPIVCVGNITVGGTGKTPHTEYLIQVLSRNHTVAVLSRGYKRRSKGFQLVRTTMSYKFTGDEPKQIKMKYPRIPVAVCNSRVEGIKRLLDAHPEVNLVILDDAFQHRYVEAWVNVLLMDYNRPIYEDHMLPWGSLRDTKKQIARAQMVITTKCPENLRPLDFRLIHKKLELKPYQSLFFTHFKSSSPHPLFPHLSPPPIYKGQSAIVMAGIARPMGFFRQLEGQFNIVHRLGFADHYAYKMKDIRYIEALLERMPEDTIVIMTEKDAVKLMNSRKISEATRRRFHYVSIEVKFADDCGEDIFLRQIEQYVEKNHKYSITHPL